MELGRPARSRSRLFGQRVTENLNSGGARLFTARRRRSPLEEGDVVVAIDPECGSSLESFCLHPSDIIFSPPHAALSQSSESRWSSAELREARRPATCRVAAPAPAPVPASALAPASAQCRRRASASVATDAVPVIETESAALKTVYLQSNISGAPPLEISLNHVRSLPPREQAKLPVSALRAAQLDAVPEVDYSKKYGFTPFRSPSWKSPRYIASRFILHPCISSPLEVPSYLREVVHPISDLRYFAKPWWMRMCQTSKSDGVGYEMKRRTALKRNYEDESSSESYGNFRTDDQTYTLVHNPSHRRTYSKDVLSTSSFDKSSRSTTSHSDSLHF